MNWLHDVKEFSQLFANHVCANFAMWWRDELVLVMVHTTYGYGFGRGLDSSPIRPTSCEVVSPLPEEQTIRPLACDRGIATIAPMAVSVCADGAEPGGCSRQTCRAIRSGCKNQNSNQ
jgi:hypothetical protein